MNKKDVACQNIDYIFNQVSKQEGVKSLTLIGKDPMFRTIEKENDFDMVIIYDKLTADRYVKLENILENARNLETKDVGIRYAIKTGPYKELSEKETTLFNHVLVYEGSTAGSKGMVLTDVSWARQKPYYGLSIAETLPRKPIITKEMLVNQHEGINYLLDLCKTNTTTHGLWIKDGEQMVKERIVEQKTDTHDILELYFYSILRCASNTLRYYTGNYAYDIDETMCRDFNQLTGRNFSLSKVPYETHTDKRLLRNKFLLHTDSLVQSYQHRAITFLEQLQQYVLTDAIYR